MGGETLLSLPEEVTVYPFSYALSHSHAPVVRGAALYSTNWVSFVDHFRKTKFCMSHGISFNVANIKGVKVHCCHLDLIPCSLTSLQCAISKYLKEPVYPLCTCIHAAHGYEVKI